MTAPDTLIDAEAVHAIKWAVQRARYMTLESVASVSDDAIVSLDHVDG